MANIKTKRLTLRQFTFDDAPFILRLLNEPSFIDNIGDKGVRDLDGARDYLRNGPMASYKQHGFGLWRVGLPESDRPIGMAGLLKRDYLENIDIGYALLSEYRGCGYAFEATSAVMDYVREKLKEKRVLAIVNDDNKPSIRLLKKLGFEANGKMLVPGEDKEVSLFASDTDSKVIPH